jgi:hypothetical protein
VRPDGVVAWRTRDAAGDAPSALTAVLEQVLGQGTTVSM